MHAGGRLLADRPLRGRRFSLQVELPPRDSVVRVTAVDAEGAPAHVVGRAGLRAAAPRPGRGSSRSGSIVLWRTPFAGSRTATAGTERDLRASLTSGGGAAWNARARFPGASTLKLAIAVAVLRAHVGLPAPGSGVDALLRAMLLRSDNASANELEAWLGGSTSAGSHVVEATLRAIGLTDTIMYGGYDVEPLRLPQAAIPIRTEQQPSFGARQVHDRRGSCAAPRAVWLAADGRGPLARTFPGGFTPSDARYLLRLLALVHDPGKLDRFLPAGDLLLHKAGWLATSRHDCGLVLWNGGAIVAAVLTWSPSGVGTVRRTSSPARSPAQPATASPAEP